MSMKTLEAIMHDHWSQNLDSEEVMISSKRLINEILKEQREVLDNLKRLKKPDNVDDMYIGYEAQKKILKTHYRYLSQFYMTVFAMRNKYK